MSQTNVEPPTPGSPSDLAPDAVHELDPDPFFQKFKVAPDTRAFKVRKTTLLSSATDVHAANFCVTG